MFKKYCIHYPAANLYTENSMADGSLQSTEKWYSEVLHKNILVLEKPWAPSPPLQVSWTQGCSASLLGWYETGLFTESLVWGPAVDLC